MARVVISFLGYHSDKVYDYLFPDGSKLAQKPLFLPALLEHLESTDQPVDRLLVIGAETSAWTRLAEQLLPRDEASRTKLNEFRRILADWQKRLDLAKPDDDPDQQELADAWSALFPGHETEGAKYHAAVLEAGPGSKATQQDRQLETLAAMQKVIGSRDEVVLDLTQGMRHQPLIALLVALYLDRLPANKDVKIEGIYAASVQYDRHGNECHEVPVRDLTSILDLAAWIFALGQFEASGDTGVFTEVLEADKNSGTAVKLLKKGARLERATRTEAAAKKIKEALQQLGATADTPPTLNGAGAAFAGRFAEALDWVHESDSFHQQRGLARRHLDHRDWLRAATLMYETCCIRLLDNMLEEKMTERENKRFFKGKQYQQRHSAADNYANRNATWFAPVPVQDRDAFDQRVADFKLLTAIRNALAHAGEPDDAVEAVVAVPDDLHTELNRLYDALLRDGRRFP